MIEDYDQSARQQPQSPLPSTLANQGPEFDRIIDQFVHKLPELLVAIENAYLAGEYTKVFELVHNLKGMGGGFGYPQLTDLAMQIESAAQVGDYQGIAPMIAALFSLARRIRAARPS